MKRRDFLKLVGVAPNILETEKHPINKELAIIWTERDNNNKYISYNITVGQGQTDYHLYKKLCSERELIKQWNRDLNREEVAQLLINPFCASSIK